MRQDQLAEALGNGITTMDIRAMERGWALPPPAVAAVIALWPALGRPPGAVPQTQPAPTPYTPPLVPAAQREHDAFVRAASLVCRLHIGPQNRAIVKLMAEAVHEGWLTPDMINIILP